VSKWQGLAELEKESTVESRRWRTWRPRAHSWSRSQHSLASQPRGHHLRKPRCCEDPGLPIRNTRYAYNSRSHDQCVVNPHIRVDNRITSSFTVPNNILTIGHMTKHDIAMQGKSITKQRIPSSVDDPDTSQTYL
jgi:hypothetical protein